MRRGVQRGVPDCGRSNLIVVLTDGFTPWPAGTAGRCARRRRADGRAGPDARLGRHRSRRGGYPVGREDFEPLVWARKGIPRAEAERWWEKAA